MIGAQPAQTLRANWTVLFSSSLYLAVPLTGGKRSDGLNVYSLTVVMLAVSWASTPVVEPPAGPPAVPLPGIVICGGEAAGSLPALGRGRLIPRHAAKATRPATT